MHSEAEQDFIEQVSRWLGNLHYCRKDTIGGPLRKGLNVFNRAFLESAPSSTITLLAKLCAKPPATSRLLDLPAELRLSVYRYLIDDQWKFRRSWHIDRRSWSPITLQHSRAVKRYAGTSASYSSWYEPHVLHTCKLMRKEGMSVYHKFMTAQARQDMPPYMRKESKDWWSKLNGREREYPWPMPWSEEVVQQLCQSLEIGMQRSACKELRRLEHHVRARRVAEREKLLQTKLSGRKPGDQRRLLESVRLRVPPAVDGMAYAMRRSQS